MAEIKNIKSLDKTLSYNLIPFRSSGKDYDILNYRKIKNGIKFYDNFFFILDSDIAIEFLLQMRNNFHYFKNEPFKASFFTLIDKSDTIHPIFTINNITFEIIHDYLLQLVSEDKTHNIKSVGIHQTTSTLNSGELIISNNYQPSKYNFEDYLKMIEPLDIQSSFDKFILENSLETRFDEFKNIYLKYNHYIADEKPFIEMIEKWKQKIRIKKLKKALNETN